MHLASLKSINQQTKHPSAKHREGWWRLPRFLERGSGMKAFADFRMAAQRHTSTSLVGSLCGTKNKGAGWLAAVELSSTSKTFIHAFTLDFTKTNLFGSTFSVEVFVTFWIRFCVFFLCWKIHMFDILLGIDNMFNEVHVEIWAKNTSFRPSPFFHIQSKLCPRFWHTHGHFSAMRKKKARPRSFDSLDPFQHLLSAMCLDTISSPHPTPNPKHGVASTMSASSRNGNIPTPPQTPNSQKPPKRKTMVKHKAATQPAT